MTTFKAADRDDIIICIRNKHYFTSTAPAPPPVQYMCT